MGSSSHEGKQWIFDFLRAFNGSIKSVLDLGAGSGTYRDIMSPALPGATWTAVEIFKPYIDHFKLHTKYSKVYQSDIRQFIPAQNYDVVIAGDVLEHMTKAEAVTVVTNHLPMCKYLIISIPIVKYPQGEFDNNPYQAHVKDDWSHQEFMSSFPNIERFWTGEEIGVYVVRGYVV